MATFEGVFTPLVTFFGEDGELDLESQRRHATFLVNAGVRGLVPMASMGEFTALDRDEKRQVTEAVIGEVSGRAQIVVHAGAPSTRQAVILAKDAEAAGADGIMAITPFYLKPNLDGLRRHYESLRAAVEIPIMAYCLPAYTGVSLPVPLILDLAREGTIQGLKDSTGDLSQALEILADRPEGFSMLTGADPLLASVLLLGGQGGVVGSTNAFPHLAVGIYRLLREGRVQEAMEIQGQLIRFTQAAQIGTFPAAPKYMVEQAWGLQTQARPPVEPLTKGERRKVDELIAPLFPG